MKKIFYFMLVCMLGVGWGSAQSVEYYVFSSEQGTSYTGLEGAESLSQTTSVAAADYPLTFFNATESVRLSTNDTAMAGIPIGFDFVYEGKTYDKFVAAGIGYIYLGLKEESKVKIHVDGTINVNNLYRMVGPSIGVSSDGDITCSAPIKYKSEGEDGSRVLTVEYTTTYGFEGAEPFHYQIKLYEAGNRIELLFDEMTIDYWYQRLAVGLCGHDGLNYYLQPKNGNWNEVGRNTSNGWVQAFYTEFEKGLQYTFTVPGECTAPSETVAALELESTSTEVYISTTVTEGSADSYLIVRSTDPITGKPADGQVYAEKDALLGGTVVLVEELKEGQTEIVVEEDKHNPQNLDPNTEYYYAVFLYNFKCAGGVKYGDGVSGSMKTKTSAPASLTITALSEERIDLKAEANALGESIIVAVTDRHGADKNNNMQSYGDFGFPAADAKVGDTIEKADGTFGGKIIYVGDASGAISFGEGLTLNKIYHFGAFSKSGEDGMYSTVFARADTITPAKIPFFEDFTGMIERREPYGWTGTTGFTVQLIRTGGGISLSMPSITTDEIRTNYLVFPPMDFPQEKNLRFIMDYRLDYYPIRSKEPLNRALWADNDSIVFEVSTDGGNTYAKTYAITKANADNFPSSGNIKRLVTIKGFTGAEQARLRLRYTTSLKYTIEFAIGTVRLIEVPDCDYPQSVSIDQSSLVGDKALVSWVPGESGEKFWNISYAKKSSDTYEEWTPNLNTAENPYLLEKLENNTTYKVRVQAVCGIGSESDWTESAEFTSGWTAPFIEDFDNLPEVMIGMRPSIALPNRWEVKRQPTVIMADTLKFDDLVSHSVDFYQWKSDYDANPGMDNGSIAFGMNFNEGMAVLRLPVVEIDAEENPSFVFTAAYGMIEDDMFTKVSNTDTAYKMWIWVSTDGGKTFAVNSALQTWNSTELVKFDSTPVKVDLSAYDGEIVVAIGVNGVYDWYSPYHILWLDNMGIVYDCLSPRNLKLENLTETEATLVWDRNPMVTEWIVKLEGEGKTQFLTTPEHRIELTDLQAVTPYKAYVGYLCGVDTADWSIFDFTTGGAECDPLTGLTVTDITKTSAKLSWTGESSNYRVRIRPAKKTASWTVFTTDKTSYQFDILLAGTEYECGVQAVCGMAIGDTGAYVAFENFTTRAENCFAPMALATSEVSYSSVKLAWEGDADDYQIDYRKDGTNVSLGRVVVTGAKTHTLTGLAASTPYQVRVRSICAAGDTSAWCEYVGFTTIAIPECPVPSDLKVEAITENSARLMWSADAQAENFIVRYRPSTATSWDSVKNLSEKAYDLTSLQPKTAYVWTVLAACSDNRYSGWAAANNFETEGVGNESRDAFGLKVSATKGQIYVMNPGAIMIDRIRVIGVDGALLEDYTVRSDENVILTTGVSKKVAIVIAESNGRAFRFKVLLP